MSRRWYYTVLTVTYETKRSMVFLFKLHPYNRTVWIVIHSWQSSLCYWTIQNWFRWVKLRRALQNYWKRLFISSFGKSEWIRKVSNMFLVTLSSIFSSTLMSWNSNTAMRWGYARPRHLSKPRRSGSSLQKRFDTNFNRLSPLIWFIVVSVLVPLAWNSSNFSNKILNRSTVWSQTVSMDIPLGSI